MDLVKLLGASSLLPQPLASLSGGELRRVLLLRALLCKPNLLVLDEPTAGVDVGGQAELYALLKRLSIEMACAVLMVSHDLYVVMAGASRVICLNHHICCEGTPQHVGGDASFRAMFGDDWFTDHLPNLDNKDAQIQLLGIWCVELAELAAINGKEAAKIKQFLTSPDDRFRLPFEKIAKNHKDVEELAEQTASAPHLRAAQKRLAFEVTALVHSPEDAQAAIDASAALFGQGELSSLGDATLRSALSELPNVQAEPGAQIAALLVETGLVASLSAGRRAIAEGGVYLNNVKIEDENASLDDFIRDEFAVLRRGKKTLAGIFKK
jgi:ABC-type multidrug transport system ATPase subunit